ncbi:MAG: GDP-mannose 4,6-dehydratase [Polymorphobacter sp.]
MTRALIVGVSGQDGAYLARLLGARGTSVWGTTRAAAPLPALAALGIGDAVTIRPLAADADAGAVAALLDAAQPDQIYHLAGVHAGDAVLGSRHPGTVVSIEPWLAALRQARATRLFAAVSAQAFGDCRGAAATETTPFQPQTRFAAESAAVALAVARARDDHGLHAVAGLMFAHASRFAPPATLAQTIIAAAFDAARGAGAPLRLADLDSARDLGWAAEYVDAMTLMLRAEVAADLVIASGVAVSARDIAEWAFGYFKRDWRDHVVVDAALHDPAAPVLQLGDPARAAATLGWRAGNVGRELIETLCEGHAAAHG